ncbi:hypothetical protein MY11210_007638 [Beauveria gryllotalpidicola]
MTETFAFFGRRYKAPGDGPEAPGTRPGRGQPARKRDMREHQSTYSDPLAMAFYLDFGVQAWSACSDGVVDLKVSLSFKVSVSQARERRRKGDDG